MVYLALSLPALWTIYQGLNGGLGADPVKGMEHALGKTALQLFVASLCITPLRRFLGLNLLRFRRALGLLTFLYVLLHLLVWAVLDVQSLSRVGGEIIKRPYVTVGMASFLLLLPLALTSNTLSLRRLGKRWGLLHRLVYPAVLLAGVHYVWLVKGFQIEPLLYLAGIVVLLALRRIPRHRAPSPAKHARASRL